jgi:hypothetical protein
MITDNHDTLTLDQIMKGKEERDRLTIDKLKFVCTPCSKTGHYAPHLFIQIATTHPLVKLFILIISNVYLSNFLSLFMSLRELL